MGNITFDLYLANRGLTEVIFCRALNISQKQLESHNIFISVVKTPKKKGIFWQIQAFLNGHENGIFIGIGDYKEKQIKKTIDHIKNATGKERLPGIWPPAHQPFVAWLREQYAYTNQTAKPRVYALEMVINFVQQLPSLENLQKQHDDLQSFQNFLTVREWKFLAELTETIADLKMLKQSFANEEEVERLTHLGSQILSDKGDQHLLKILSSDCIKYNGVLFQKRHLNQILQESKNVLNKAKLRQTQEHQLQLLADLPPELAHKILDLQRQVKQRKYSFLCLSAIDYKFIEAYGTHQEKLLEIFDYQNVTSQDEIIRWIEEWIKRVEKALLEPTAASDYELILALIADSPKYGTTTYAMWLGKSKAKSLEGKRLKEIFRGALGQYSIVDITRMIEDMRFVHRLLEMIYVGKHDLPVLIPSKKGRDLLKTYVNEESLPKKKIKKTSQTKKTSKETEVSKLPETPEKPISHMDRLKEALKNKDRYFWLTFLEDSVSVKQIGEWDEEQLKQIQQMLEENIPGWKIPLLWELEKHPIKNKPLKRLL